MSGCTNPNQRCGWMIYVLCIVIGIVICICPGSTLLVICRIGGFLLLLFGGWRLILCVKKH